jgi:hypothetical protein
MRGVDGRIRTADLEDGTTASRQSFRQGDWLELARFRTSRSRLGEVTAGVATTTAPPSVTRAESSVWLVKDADEGVWRTGDGLFGFHFGTQPRITQRHMAAPTVR